MDQKTIDDVWGLLGHIEGHVHSARERLSALDAPEALRQLREISGRAFSASGVLRKEVGPVKIFDDAVSAIGAGLLGAAEASRATPRPPDATQLEPKSVRIGKHVGIQTEETVPRVDLYVWQTAEEVERESLSVEDLRRIAKSVTEVANWLDAHHNPVPRVTPSLPTTGIDNGSDIDIESQVVTVPEREHHDEHCEARDVTSCGCAERAKQEATT